MNFPHLSDTEFPNLPTVDVYSYQNNFDYSRWNEKTKVKLVNVLWNSDYTDVVKWDTNAVRDSYFDSITDYWTVELATSARVVPEGFIKLPIPYDIMARYNYLFIDMPIATSPNNMIDYENTQGLRRWYFFIDSVQYLSPNATRVYLQPDIWTNFQNDIEITYMLLERGHAPVAASDTDTYLSNPMQNNRYLLAPDVNFDNAGITKSSDFVPFGNGTKYVCFASTCAPNSISNLGSISVDPNYNPTGNITYSDIQERYGHQLEVHGFSVGNGYDYSNANTPANVGFSDGLIANNLTVYAIPATQCYGNGTFYSDILHVCPQFLTTIKACFVVDEACITLGNSHTIAGHTVYQCVGKPLSTLFTKQLNKADFDYPNELRRFAKLYTSPYAQLEITDNDGTTYNVNIEETSTLNVKTVTSIAFPYINERVYIEGIGGQGSTSYSWVDLNGTNSQRQMPNSDWFKYCFDWQIPTFALYMDGQTAFMLESFNRNVKQAGKQALVSYHNTMRSANTAYENACDTADTGYTNTAANALTAKGNSDRSADTGKTNADNNRRTAHTNTYNSADTSHTNTYNDAALAYRVIDRTCTAQMNNLVRLNTATAANEETGITASSSITSESNASALECVTYTNLASQATQDANRKKTAATNVSSFIGSVMGGATSGASQGVIMGASVGGTALAAVGTAVEPGGGTALGGLVGSAGGAIAGTVAGAVIGGVGGAINAATNGVNAGIITDTEQTIVDEQVRANNNTYTSNAQAATRTTNIQNDARRVVYRTNANASVDQMTTTNTCSRTNAQDTKTTAETNADNIKSTAETNADNINLTAKRNAINTQTTSKSNAQDTYDTTIACAGRTQTNVKDNAGYTREVSELNAKELLENSANTSMAAINDARNSAPIECCPYSGNPQPDYMRTRGIQIKVKTQNESAIRQTGDIFARFGYALNQVWDVASSGLKMMQHFTYWKATELWVDDSKSSNNNINNFIHKMFLNGVTVWNNPTEIGRINVYNN